MIGWDQACGSVGKVDSSSNMGSGWRVRALADRGPSAIRRKEAMSSAARQIRSDLLARHVLCDVAHPCNVTVVQRWSVQICLHRSAAVGGAMVCEPWGEIWQQQGGPVGSWSNASTPPRSTRLRSGIGDWADRSSGCTTFDVAAIARWWAGLRSSDPYFSNADAVRRRKQNGW